MWKYSQNVHYAVETQYIVVQKLVIFLMISKVKTSLVSLRLISWIQLPAWSIV